MTLISILQATNEDIPYIEDIMRDVIKFLKNINQPQWEEKNVTWEGLSKHFSSEDFYIAYLGNEPVGCMALINYDPVFWPDIKKGESLFIHKLAVKRCAAKKGISNALIDFAKKKAIESSIGAVRLDCHTYRQKVRSLYESEGFVCVGEKCLFERYQTAFYVWERILYQ